MKTTSQSLYDRALLQEAAWESVKRLSPRYQVKNPVMFVVWLGSLLTTGLWLQALAGEGEAPAGFILAITLWLWFTVLFANFAEAVAEGRGKAQAAALKGLKKTVWAKKLREAHAGAPFHTVPSEDLRKGDVVLVQAGDVIPGDGEVVEGVASVDESAITGESAPVIRESGGDFSAVTGGTRVLSDWLVVKITVNPGETFLDRMISLVEGASRKKTPNEIALNILLAGLTLIFLVVVVTLGPFADYAGTTVSVEAVAATRLGCNVAGWTLMSANRLTVACCIRTSGAVLPRSWLLSRPQGHWTVPAPNTKAPLLCLYRVRE